MDEQLSPEEIQEKSQEFEKDLQDFDEKQAPKEPVFFERGDKEYRVNTFKLKNSKMLVNRAWQRGDYMPVMTEHSHVFHDKDRRGVEHLTCSPMGTHFHVMEMKDENGNWLLDDEGKLKPRVGPPMKYGYEKSNTGKMVKRLMPIKYYEASTDTWHEDNHRHEVENLGSEILSPNKIKQSQTQMRQQFETLNKVK